MPARLALTAHATTVNITVPAVGALVTVTAAVSVALLEVGQTVLYKAETAQSNNGQLTITITEIGVDSYTGTFLGAEGDSDPGATVNTRGITYLLSDPSFGEGCDIDALLLDASCLSPFCLNDADREGIVIYARVLALAAAGGADYTGDIEALRSAAGKWKLLSEKQRHQVWAYHSVRNAITNGAGISTDPDTLKAAAACYICIPDNARDNILLYLACLLNSRGLAD